MKYYIFTDYDSGDKLLFDNLDSAMEFVKEYQIDDIRIWRSNQPFQAR